MASIFTRMLVGVDDSQPARDALTLAVRLAREHDGEIVLCSVVDWVPLVSESEAGGAITNPQPIIDALRTQAEALVAHATTVATQAGVRVTSRIAEGYSADQLLAVAIADRCTLLVLGTHGRRGLGRFFIGSTTEAVLRQSQAPVLTVREGCVPAATDQHAFERVLVGVDDSEPADAALAAVLALPPDDRRFVTVCCVADPETVIGFGYPNVREDLCRQAQGVVDAALAKAHERGIAADGAVVEGSVGAEIVAEAQRERADAIVVGSHGRRGVRRFFLGSVAEGIVRTAPVPVLVVRAAT